MLDKDALKRFAPKEFHRHFKEFDDLLQRLILEKPAYRQLVENPFAIFRDCKAIPVIHLVAMMRSGRWDYFPLPAQRVRPGHRVVQEGALGQGFSLSPLLQLEVVTDPLLTQVVGMPMALSVLRSKAKRDEIGETFRMASTPAQLFSIPLPLMLKPHAQRFHSHRFTLYQHIFGNQHEYPVDGAFYIGITSREWQRRWREHWAAIQRGSKLKFHQEYRDRVASKNLTFVHHKVMGVAPSLERLQEMEEFFVEGHWEDQRLLNMIPGGKAGLAYLHRYNIIRKAKDQGPEDVEKTLEGWIRDNPRKGLPAPWVAESWTDPEYAARVICGPRGRFSVEQVMLIRRLGEEGLSADEIALRIEARDLEQIRRLLAGKTYSRVTDIVPGE